MKVSMCVNLSQWPFILQRYKLKYWYIVISFFSVFNNVVLESCGPICVFPHFSFPSTMPYLLIVDANYSIKSIGRHYCQVMPQVDCWLRKYCDYWVFGIQFCLNESFYCFVFFEWLNLNQCEKWDCCSSFLWMDTT